MPVMPKDKSIGLFDVSELPNRGEFLEAVHKVYNALQNKPKSIIVELNIYRKYCPILMKVLILSTEIQKTAIREKEQALNGIAKNTNKRWTEEEDNALIEKVCDPNENIQTLSIIFGRTPAAISNRITTLVGVKRLSQEVAGRFVGYINGERTEADIAGIVHKEAM